MVVLVCISFLGACAQNMQAIGDMYKASRTNDDPNRFAIATLNPQFRYLEVHGPGVQALMALGFVEPVDGQPPVETWYGGDNELLRLQGGHLLGLTGVAQDEVAIQYTWQSKNDLATLLPVKRTMDDPAKQAFGVQQTLAHSIVPAQQVPTRGSALRTRLMKVHQELLWLRIEVAGGDIPASLYAYSPAGAMVYGSQCIAATRCYEWLYRNIPGTNP